MCLFSQTSVTLHTGTHIHTSLLQNFLLISPPAKKALEGLLETPFYKVVSFRFPIPLVKLLQYSSNMQVPKCRIHANCWSHLTVRFLIQSSLAPERREAIQRVSCFILRYDRSWFTLLQMNVNVYLTLNKWMNEKVWPEWIGQENLSYGSFKMKNFKSHFRAMLCFTIYDIYF